MTRAFFLHAVKEHRMKMSANAARMRIYIDANRVLGPRAIKTKWQKYVFGLSLRSPNTFLAPESSIFFLTLAPNNLIYGITTRPRLGRYFDVRENLLMKNATKKAAKKAAKKAPAKKKK